MKNAFFFAVTCGVLQMHTALADGLVAVPPPGAGQFGANRRVRTLDSDFTAVKGNFTLPTVRVPATSPNIVTGLNNPFRSNPTFYFGCSAAQIEDSETGEFIGGLEVDAGLQYESARPAIGTGQAIPKGWAVIVRASNERAVVRQNFVSADKKWRAGSNVTSVTLVWTVYKLSVANSGGYGGYLQVTANGASGPLPESDQPQDPDLGSNKIRAQLYSPDSSNFNRGRSLIYNISGMRVKRVVAINQGRELDPATGAYTGPILPFPYPNGGIYAEDGSYLRNCTFSGGQISQQISAPSVNDFGAAYNPSAWVTWDASNTDNNNKTSVDTGYYPGGRDKTLVGDDAKTYGNAPTSLPILDFTGTLTNAGTPLPPTQWDDAVSSRYANETVSINLRNGTATNGTVISSSGGATPNAE